MASSSVFGASMNQCYAPNSGLSSILLPSESIDFIFSTGALEIIPRRALINMMLEFRRLSSKAGIASYWVTLGDAYATFDRTITPFNFLKYPANRWRYLVSPMNPTNRLRISDYRDLFEKAGYEIVKERNSSGSAETLGQIRLAPEFQEYKTEDLLVLTSWIVARPT